MGGGRWEGPIETPAPGPEASGLRASVGGCRPLGWGSEELWVPSAGGTQRSRTSPGRQQAGLRRPAPPASPAQGHRPLLAALSAAILGTVAIFNFLQGALSN